MLSLTETVLRSTWVAGYKSGTGYIKIGPYIFSLGYCNGWLLTKGENIFWDPYNNMLCGGITFSDLIFHRYVCECVDCDPDN